VDLAKDLNLNQDVNANYAGRELGGDLHLMEWDLELLLLLVLVQKQKQKHRVRLEQCRMT
jgi:hypothetical protein